LIVSRAALSLCRLHPLVVLALYAGLITGYRRYLDGSLKYIKPSLPAAPEDVLGFGFWIPWLIFAGWFAIACVLSYRYALQRRVGYWAPILCAFVVLTLLDFYLYGVLEHQVIGG
jgi:hypothetical protein